jgi:hypothetical protein
MFGFAPSVRYTTPGGPSPCPRHYNKAFGYYAASALPSAPWHFRVLPREVKRHGSSPVPTQATRATRSGLLYAGRFWGQRLPTFGLDRPSALPCWLWGVSATLHPALLTTLHTEVSRVRIGRRTRTFGCPWLGHRRPFLSRLQTPMGATHRRPLHSPHTVVHVRFSKRTISCAVKGRTRTHEAQRRGVVCRVRWSALLGGGPFRRFGLRFLAVTYGLTSYRFGCQLQIPESFGATHFSGVVRCLLPVARGALPLCDPFLQPSHRRRA